MRRLLLALVAVGLIAFTSVVNPTPAAACSCLGISTRRAAEQAEAVFLGTVTKVEESRIGGERAAELASTSAGSTRAPSTADQVITTPADSAGCGLTPDVGSTWVIFASGVIQGEGKSAKLRLTTTLCSGNLSGDTSPPRAWAGRPSRCRGPRTGWNAPETTDARLTRGLVIGGVGVLGLGALIGIGLAYLWRRQAT